MTRLWLRLELVRRRRSLIVLTLLVAFATATVLASVAGARRGSSAVDRLAAVTLPVTAVVLPNQPGFDWSKVSALPEVAALTRIPVTGFGVDDLPIDVAVFPPSDSAVFHTIERPVVLAGRLADPTRSDEVMVTAAFPGRFHKGVGDTVTLRLMSTAQTQDGSGSNPSSAAELKGPRIPARIVGIIRSPWYSDHVGQDPAVIPSPALYRTYPRNMIGPAGFVNALVRLRHGSADIPAFRADLARVTGRSDIDVWDVNTRFKAPEQRVDRFEAASLLAFGLAALAAALMLIGQSVARYSAATVTDLKVLRAVGLAPRQAVATAASAPTLAATLGAVLGIAGAAIASYWMPIGSAGDYEPAPGFSIDWLVLGLGALAVPLLVLAGSAAAAAAAYFPSGQDGGTRRSAVALLASRAGLPIPVVVGARFALEPGQGRSAVPVRPTLLGAVAGVLGVLAAFTFAAGVHDAATHPARFGRTHQLEAYVGVNGHDYGPAAQAIAATLHDHGVRAVDDALVSPAESGRVVVSTYTFNPNFPIILREGRMPLNSGEIVLAPGSAHALGVGVGGSVTLKGGRTPTRMVVTGLGFLPVGAHNDYNDGGWVTPAGHDRLFAGAAYAFKFHVLLVELRPEADLRSAAARLQAATGGLDFTTPKPITQIPEIRDVEQLPLLLAGFLAILAIGAVGHALATAVQRRQHEVAVLRAHGMTRRQARWAVVTQATLLVLIGLAFGVPLGVALGRTLWRTVADMMPLQYLPPLAMLPLLLIGPLALLLANTMATWPARTAARLRISHVLRAE